MAGAGPAPRSEIGRLALRVEGDLWNAYYALPDSMEGAIFLGSVRIGAVRDGRRKNAFMALMTEIVGDFIETEVGQRPSWLVQTAPEHERGGSA